MDSVASKKRREVNVTMPGKLRPGTVGTAVEEKKDEAVRATPAGKVVNFFVSKGFSVKGLV